MKKIDSKEYDNFNPYADENPDDESETQSYLEDDAEEFENECTEENAFTSDETESEIENEKTRHGRLNLKVIFTSLGILVLTVAIIPALYFTGELTSTHYRQFKNEDIPLSKYHETEIPDAESDLSELETLMKIVEPEYRNFQKNEVMTVPEVYSDSTSLSESELYKFIVPSILAFTLICLIILILITPPNKRFDLEIERLNKKLYLLKQFSEIDRQGLPLPKSLIRELRKFFGDKKGEYFKTTGNLIEYRKIEILENKVDKLKEIKIEDSSENSNEKEFNPIEFLESYMEENKDAAKFRHLAEGEYER